MTMQLPESRQRGGQAGAARGCPTILAPAQRRAQIIVFLLQTGEPGRLLWSRQLRLGGLG
jgi:hypothetical protein